MPLARLEKTRRAYCRCDGNGWVCEEHRGRPFQHDGCTAAGDPCPTCQPQLANGVTANVIEGEQH